MKTSYLLLIIVMIFFSGNFVIGKALANVIPPFTLAFIRWGIAFLFLLPFSLKEVRGNRPLWIQEWKPILAMSLTGIFGFSVLLYVSVIIQRRLMHPLLMLPHLLLQPF